MMSYPPISLDDHLPSQRERRIKHNIEALTEKRRAEMAVLILAGYQFIMGNIYWRCATPQGGICSTLDELHNCIIAALEHRNQVALDSYVGDAR